MNTYIAAIVRDIRRGELTRDIDESGASGFWDLAGEIASAVHNKHHDSIAESGRQDQLQQLLYDHFWDIAELSINKG